MSLTRPVNTRLEGIAKRASHFKRKHEYAKQFDSHGNPDVAGQLRACQETEVLACCSNCGKSWWILNRCRLRVCPLCSYQVAMERADFLKALTSKMSHPKMITLTMPLWTKEPREGIKYLRAAWNKLRATALMKQVRGGAYQIEIKIKPEGYHIHIHVLLDCPFLPYQKLFTSWRDILKVKCPQVHIQAATSDKAKAYVCKYAAKASDFDAAPETIVEWYDITKGIRLFATFGEWYNITAEEIMPDKFADHEEPSCPFCGHTHSTFLARDGPFVFGQDDWRQLGQSFTHGQFPERRIPGALEAIYGDSITQQQITLEA